MKKQKILFPTPIAGSEACGKIPTQTTGKSLYFHIPFCRKKCPYCHFYSIPFSQEKKEHFLAALKIEWEKRKKSLLGHEIVSIYFGGGTPSLLGRDLERILEWIGAPSSCEITLEANPSDLSFEDLSFFRKMGVNRLSLGIQSFDDSLLAILKRSHSAQENLQAIHWAEQAGFENLSIDLLYDLPQQTIQSWEKTLLTLRDLPITHLSLYNLVFEPNTYFWAKKASLAPLLPNPKESLALLQMASRFLESLQLNRYEISAFAKKGFFSKHNVGYWIGRPFLGFGPSAFSYEEGKRGQNVSQVDRYCEKLSKGQLPTCFEEKLSFPHNLQELLAIELRLIQGVNLELFQKKHQALPEQMLNALCQLQEKGLLKRTKETIALTRKGQLFYDLVAETLL